VFVSPPRACIVSIRDSEGVTHSVQVQGSSLSEAAARAVAAFREQKALVTKPGIADAFH
jgi:hypothetical protein